MGEKKKIIHNQWFIGVGASLIGAFLYTAITSLVKSQNFLTTLGKLFQFLYSSIIWIINIDIKFYHVIFIAVYLFVIDKTRRKQNKKIDIVENPIPDFVDYTRDAFNGNIFWTWKYAGLPEYEHYVIDDLFPECPDCQTRMHLTSSNAECPRCHKLLYKISPFEPYVPPGAPKYSPPSHWLEDTEDIEAVIRDNIRREKYKEDPKVL